MGRISQKYLVSDQTVVHRQRILLMIDNIHAFVADCNNKCYEDGTGVLTERIELLFDSYQDFQTEIVP